MRRLHKIFSHEAFQALPQPSMIMYLALLSYQEGKGRYTAPTQQVLAVKTGSKLRTVKSSIKHLRENGYITVVRGERNSYEVVDLDTLQGSELKADSNSAFNAPRESASNAPSNSASNAPSRVSERSPNPSPKAPPSASSSPRTSSKNTGEERTGEERGNCTETVPISSPIIEEIPVILDTDNATSQPSLIDEHNNEVATSKKFKFEQCDVEFTERLLRLLKSRFRPGSKLLGNIEKHYSDCRLLRESGNSEVEEKVDISRIETVFEFLEQDDRNFWPKNIRSMGKFRKQFFTVEAQAIEAGYATQAPAAPVKVEPINADEYPRIEAQTNKGVGIEYIGLGGLGNKQDMVCRGYFPISGGEYVFGYSRFIESDTVDNNPASENGRRAALAFNLLSGDIVPA